jgi:hypothetical protein
MRLGASCCHQLAADRHRKRQVGETIAVDVPEFAPADAEFDSAESVRRYRDAFP